MFFDVRLSANGEVSCATCHQIENRFTDGLQKAEAIGQLRRTGLYPTQVVEKGKGAVKSAGGKKGKKPAKGKAKAKSKGAKGQALFGGNKVIVAPTDSESIFCFSKTDGQFLWETTAPDSRYLICSSEKSIVSSGIGLSWFDLESGARIANFPNVVPSSVKGLQRSS